MQFNTGDILIFREKKLMHALYSMVSLDLDNHIGILVKLNNKIYLNHFVITNFKNLLLNVFFNYNYKCGKVVLTPVDYLKNKEYYHYKIIENIEIDEETVKKAIKKAETLNYLSNIPALINFLLGRKYFNCGIKKKGHTCLSYVEWFGGEISLYDIKYLDDDYYKKDHNVFVKKDKNYIINGMNVNYKLVGANNVGKKDISKFNPYKWAYIISFLYNFITLLFLKVKNKNNETVPFYKTIIGLFLITIFATFGGYYFNKKIDSKTEGRRYIGCIIGIAFVNIIFCENILNIDQNDMLYINYMFSMPRIFFTRSASWIVNDLPGKINKKTLRPYDTAFYEAIYEGLVPFLFLIVTSSFLEKKTQNLAVTIIYSGSRFYIEFYKKSYIKNSILTLGQIDTIINWVVIYWYITCNASIPNKLFQYLLLNVFFFDINNRVSKNKLGYTTSLTKNIKLIWKKTYNKGFLNGHYKEKGKIFKLMYPIATLSIYNLFLINNLDFLYIFNCFALLNIFERFLNGHVTDYLTIQIYNYKTFNLNYADIIINLFTLKLFIKYIC
jgi:lipoprotein signal peptidase